MSGPCLSIELELLRQNSAQMVELCRDRGISVTGVTKVSCGMPPVARALIDGGVTSIGESRMENIYRLRASGISAPVMLLRIPPLSAVEEIVTSVDVSLNSELSVIEALSGAAADRGLVHKIILMVDLGDLREGIWPEDLVPLANRVVDLPGVKIVGLGTNLTCYGGILPTAENMNTLASYADLLEKKFPINLEWISGGNSSALPLLLKGKMPSRINNLRIGEAIMLGRETAFGKKLAGFSGNVFSLKAELLEKKEKPSVPIGEAGMDAFGGKPVFEDNGRILRGILNIGREDVSVDGLIPDNPDLSILGASSDHLLIDITEADPCPSVGDEISFQLNYGALLASMTSSYVIKYPVLAGGERVPPPALSLVGKSARRHREYLEQSLRNLTVETGIKAGMSNSVPILVGRKPLLLEALKDLEKRQESMGMILIDSIPSMTGSFQAPLVSRLLSTALGLTDEGVNFAGRLSPENIVLLGVKKAAPDEVRIIRKMNIKTFTMEDIDLLGIREIAMRSIRRAAAATGGIILRFSGDAAGADGLTRRELHFLLELLAGSNTIRCLDVSGRPLDRRTCQYLETALGKKIMGDD